MHAVRDLPSSSVYFLIYDVVYHRLVAKGYTDRRGVFASLMAGGWAGVLSWMLVLPFDVIKSQIQKDYRRQRYSSLMECARTIWASSGWRAFYSGLIPCVLRAFPVNAITFTVNFELLKLLNSI